MQQSNFDSLSNEWWKKDGPLKLLHSMNKTRLLFIQERMLNRYKSLNQINNTNYESYYIILISDGSPNEGIESSVNFVNENINSINQNNCVNTN